MDFDTAAGIKKVCVCECHADGTEDCQNCCHRPNQIEIARLREVLKFYTDYQNHVEKHIDADSRGMHSSMQLDRGEKARVALGVQDA